MYKSLTHPLWGVLPQKKMAFFYFARTIIVRAYGQRLPYLLLFNAFFFHASTFPNKFPSQILCGIFDELPNGIGLFGGNNKTYYASIPNMPSSINFSLMKALPLLQPVR
jgi:hypothetical protein